MRRSRAREWSLQDAKARFSEVVRCARREGAQVVTMRGKPVVRIVPIPESGDETLTGQALVEAFQACPDIDEFPLIAPGAETKISDPVRF
jgi:prevent-host-death family protein